MWRIKNYQACQKTSNNKDINSDLHWRKQRSSWFTRRTKQLNAGYYQNFRNENVHCDHKRKRECKQDVATIFIWVLENSKLWKNRSGVLRRRIWKTECFFQKTQKNVPFLRTKWKEEKSYYTYDVQLLRSVRWTKQHNMRASCHRNNAPIFLARRPVFLH